jgi:hypothetical protein
VEKGLHKGQHCKGVWLQYAMIAGMVKESIESNQVNQLIVEGI